MGRCDPSSVVNLQDLPMAEQEGLYRAASVSSREGGEEARIEGIKRARRPPMNDKEKLKQKKRQEAVSCSKEKKKHKHIDD